MSSKSAMERTIAHAQDMGYDCWRAETFRRIGKNKWIKQDLGGIIDCMLVGEDIIAVQVTDGGHLSEHVKHLAQHVNTARWTNAGGRFEIWSWAPYKVKRGGTAVRYKLTRVKFPLRVGRKL